ncbi:MBL fold metallo-hydrolase [Burkholderia multivorans]|uniref:MBL fold metallo-hydrolase n=1 Tax=Burkholderia multivorans TaxID=87883 RepID=UPI00209E7219|nr:MBL fold metallo-hydrolase [Burkholderia multivorans]MCO8320332.1 MBL fold metallo-hydrolase [Burkholderia multivorans]
MNTTTVTEIRPRLFRTSTYIEKLNLSFSQFFIQSEDQTLVCVESGMRENFPAVVRSLTQIGLSPSNITCFIAPHFEADEMGALPELLAVNPRLMCYAHPICSHALADVFGARTRALKDGERVTLSGIEVVPIFTKHVHQWDALVVYLPNYRALLSSDLFMRFGDCTSTTGDPTPAIIQSIERSGYLPSLPHFAAALEKLQGWDIDLILPMHGPAIEHNARRVIGDLLNYCHSMR